MIVICLLAAYCRSDEPMRQQAMCFACATNILQDYNQYSLHVSFVSCLVRFGPGLDMSQEIAFKMPPQYIPGCLAQRTSIGPFKGVAMLALTHYDYT